MFCFGKPKLKIKTIEIKYLNNMQRNQFLKVKYSLLEFFDYVEFNFLIIL